MSQPTIELVWHTRGPALDIARSAIRCALLTQQLLPVWAEWKADDSLKPRGLRCDATGPRMYVNGRLAWTSERGWHDRDALARAIADTSGRPPRLGVRDSVFRRFKYVVLPSAALTLVPKCPLCWVAYGSITAAFGLTPLAARRVVLVGLTMTLIVGAAAVIWRSLRLHAVGPAWGVSVGTVLVLLAAHNQGPASVAYAGLGIVLSAAVWSAWPRAALPHR